MGSEIVYCTKILWFYNLCFLWAYGNSMKIIIFLSTVLIAKYIGMQIGLTYNIISDPFNFKLALFDFTLYLSVYFVLTFLYGKAKVFVGKN